MAHPMKQKTGRAHNKGIVRGLMATARCYKEKYEKLGRERIEFLSRKQEPTRVAVFPSVGMARLGIAPVMNGVEPGNVFTVSCMENGKLDDIAMGSLFYGFEHLHIKEVSLHGSRDVVGELREGMEGNFGKFGISIGTYVYNAEGGALSVHFSGAPKKSGKPEGYISTGDFTEPRDIEAVIVDCSDSRVMTYQVFKGHNVAVISNAGNVLSPTALDAIDELVREGVPAVMVFAHSNCGAVGAALAGNKEEPLAPIMKLVGANVSKGEEESGGEIQQRDTEIKNVLASCKVLLGMEYIGEQFAGHDFARLSVIRENVREKGTVVLPMYLDLANGEVTDLRPMLQGQ